jgi:hypothetical protein
MHHICLALILATLAPGPLVPASDSDQQAVSASSRTGKERLTDKASDEQRVDDCKVPPAKRTRARPTGCGLGEDRQSAGE